MKHTTRLIYTAAIAAAFGSGVAQARERMAEVPVAVTALENLEISGAIDFGYDWAANDDVLLRPFRDENDGFVLHQVNLRGQTSFGNGIGAALNIILGNDAAAVRGDNNEDHDFDLTEAYLSKTHGNLTVMGGRYTTLAGMEVINPVENVNVTRSLLFNFQPLVHTGLRATYNLGDQLSFSLGANNTGFATTESSIQGDNNTDLTFEAQIGYQPLPNLSLALTGYTGNEDDGDRAAGQDDADLRFDIVDLVVNYDLLDNLYLGLNADYFNSEDGAGGNDEAMGVAGYVNYQINDRFRVAYRSEYLAFKDGGGQGDSIVRENTLTFGYSCTPNFEIALEGRHDKSTGDAAPEIFAPINGLAEDDQYTGSIRTTFHF